MGIWTDYVKLSDETESPGIRETAPGVPGEPSPGDLQDAEGHCQSKFGYFAKTSEPDFAAIDFPAFFRVDLSGSMAALSI